MFQLILICSLFTNQPVVSLFTKSEFTTNLSHNLTLIQLFLNPRCPSNSADSLWSWSRPPGPSGGVSAPKVTRDTSILTNSNIA